MNSSNRKIIRVLFFLLVVVSCTSIDIEEINDEDYINDNKTNDKEINANEEDNLENNYNNIIENETTNNNISSNNKSSENDLEENIENNTNSISNNNLSENDIHNEQLENNDSENIEKNDKDELSDDGNSIEELTQDDLNNDFSKFFNKKIDKVNLYTDSSYDVDSLNEIRKDTEYTMLFPDDVVNISENEDWNILWEGEYRNSKLSTDNESDKDKITVRFISIDRIIPDGATNNYINDLFFGFLSTGAFQKLGIKKWKPYINSNLSEILLNKGIISSFVYSGITHYPNDKVSLVNYYVFIFFNRDKNQIVFLTTIFSFNKYAYAKMEKDETLENYYENWISFISTFKFL